MFKTKKQLKEEIRNIELDIVILKQKKDIAVNQVKEALKKEKDWSSIVNAYNDVLNKEIENLNNYIKKLEEKIVKQKQTIKDKDEYISILHDSSTLYATIKTKLQNSQLKDKLDRISAILNED